MDRCKGASCGLFSADCVPNCGPLRNHSQDVIHVIVGAINVDAKTQRTGCLSCTSRHSQRWYKSKCCVCLAWQAAAQPLFPSQSTSTPRSTRAKGADFIGTGRYNRVIEIKIWGSGTTILSATRVLRIVTPNLPSSVCYRFCHRRNWTRAVFPITLSPPVLQPLLDQAAHPDYPVRNNHFHRC